VGDDCLTAVGDKPQRYLRHSNFFSGSATVQILPPTRPSLSAYLTRPVLVGDETANLFKFPDGLNTPDGIASVDSIEDLAYDDVFGQRF